MTSESEDTMQVDEKIEFVRSTLRPMAETTFPYLTSVIGIHDAETGRHVGSGLRCMLRGHHAIVTAWHVIEKAKQEPHGFSVSMGYAAKPLVVSGDIHVDKFAYLAFCFLPTETTGGDDTCFWPAGKMDDDRDSLATDYLFLHGFPGKNSYSSQILRGVISRSLPYGAMQRLDNLPNSLAPFQFAIEYDPAGLACESGSAQDWLAPEGLSGSPVWRIGASGRSMKLWQPDEALLVGFVTHWNSQSRVLVATSVSQLPPAWRT